MLFHSIDFLLFFPVVILVYYLVPVKLRYLWLLAASYYFYLSWNVKYAVYLIPITFLTYFLGIVLERTGERRAGIKKGLVAVGVAVTIGILGVLKYTNFFFINLNRLASLFGVTLKEPEWDLLLPVGISFYTLQALGYLIDIYRGKVRAEKIFSDMLCSWHFFRRLCQGR